MIHARPKPGTLISFGLFLVISYALLGLSIYVLTRDPQPAGYHYLIVLLLTPIATYITYKVLFRYKVVSMGNHQIEVRYPQFRSYRSYALEEVESWMESVVRTGRTSTYKELEIKFKDGWKIQMGHREFTEYDTMLRYLTQRLPKSKIG